MSLLTSLIRASTQFQQALEKRQPASQPATPAGNAAQEAAAAPDADHNDDRFTRSGQNPGELSSLKTRKLQLTEYKQTVGQDLAFVRETLRHKLAEYNLHPATAIQVRKNEEGKLAVEGKMAEDTRARIESDLNHNKAFKEAFGRLSSAEPTLHFLDNALKLNQAYGVNNSLLDSLVSENPQFNGLQDLLHRYDSLRRSVSAERVEAAGPARDYAFRLNARA